MEALFCRSDGLCGVGPLLACLMELGREETECEIVRTIIEDISAYQAEIEGWGYQVTILPRLEGELAADRFDEMFWGGGQEDDVEDAPDDGEEEQ